MMKETHEWIRENFYTAALAIILTVSIIVVTVAGILYDNLNDVEDRIQSVSDASDAQDTIIAQLAEILVYLDCTTGALLLTELDDRSIEEIIQKCDLSGERIQNIRETFGD